jgi:uncharacterized protein
MSEIVSKIKAELIVRNRKYISEVQNYNFWQEHISLVVKNSLKLASEFGANREIVELGSLLHDIALVSCIGSKADHHEQGAKIAVELLEKYGYPKNKIEKVRKCVLNHRSSHNCTSIEETCVADADILAHFDNLPMVFQVAFVLKKLNLKEARKAVKYSLEKDFNDLSSKTKQITQARYDNILKVLFNETDSR